MLYIEFHTHVDEHQQVRKRQLRLKAAESPVQYVTNSPSRELYDDELGRIKLKRSLSDSYLDIVHSDENRSS